MQHMYLHTKLKDVIICECVPWLSIISDHRVLSKKIFYAKYLDYFTAVQLTVVDMTIYS